MAQNFIGCDRDRSFLLPPDLRDWLPDGHLAWFVLDAVAGMDLAGFYGAYRADGVGRRAYDPAAGHQRRVIRRAAMPIRPIGRIKRRQIQPLDAPDHKPRQMILRQPIPQRRRHQKRLLTIKTNEILRHPRIQLNEPDRTPLRDNLAWKGSGSDSQVIAAS